MGMRGLGDPVADAPVAAALDRGGAATPARADRQLVFVHVVGWVERDLPRCQLMSELAVHSGVSC